jgi:hypothetical protein
VVEEKKALRFKGTLILLIISLIIGSVYLLYVLPEMREKKLIAELSSRFFHINPDEIEFLRIQNPKGVFDIARDDDGWIIKSPIVLQTDPETIQKILDTIIKGKIMKVITADIKRMSEFGLDHPRAALSIGFGGRIDELILGDTNPSGTGIYAFARGLKAIFLVGKEIVWFSDIGLYELRSKALFVFDPDIVTGIKIIKKSGEIEMVKDKNGWYMIKPFSGRADDDEIRDFLLDVLSQRAEEFYDGRVPDASDYPETIRLLFYSDKNPYKEIDVHYWGTDVKQGVVVYQKGMKYSGRLQRDFWNLINREPSYFRYRNLFDFDIADVGAIKVKKGLSGYELLRKDKGWYVGKEPVDSKIFMEFVWFLKSWKAERLLGLSSDLNRKTPILEIILVDRHDRSIGTLKVYSKIQEKVYRYSREGEYELYHAYSDNLREFCVVSSLDLKKIPDKDMLIR